MNRPGDMVGPRSTLKEGIKARVQSHICEGLVHYWGGGVEAGVRSRGPRCEVGGGGVGLRGVLEPWRRRGLRGRWGGGRGQGPLHSFCLATRRGG